MGGQCVAHVQVEKLARVGTSRNGILRGARVLVARVAATPLLCSLVTHTRSLAHWPFFSSIDTNVAFIIEAAFCLSLPLAHAGRYCEA